MPPEQHKSFEKTLLENFEEITKSLCVVDLENADASVPEDKVAIRQLVQKDMGFAEVNNNVLAMMRGWVLEAAKALLASQPERKQATRLMVGLSKLMRVQGSAGTGKGGVDHSRGAGGARASRHCRVPEPGGGHSGRLWQIRNRAATGSARSEHP